MGELAEAGRGRVAAAGDAEIDEVAVGEVGAGQYRRHASMHGIEPVRIAEEIIGRFRRATDAGNLRHTVRLDREFEASLDDSAGDRIVTAACAQGRDLTLVVTVRVAEIVLRQLGMMEFRLDDVGHETTFRSGVTLS